jgi:glycerol-3-phosphate dehydrogenase (NAD(P)+)
MKSNICVIGAGSWGTALAIMLSNNGHQVTLWSWLQAEAELLNKERESKEFLPGVKIPKDIICTHDLKVAARNKDIIVLAIPSHVVRQNANNIKPFINPNQIIVNVAKGLEEDTYYTMSEIIEQEIPDARVCILSGPTHAEEVSRNIPSTIVVASKFDEASKYVQDVFMNDNFRVYTNNDVVGVEIGGSLKNVIALCAGISDGLGFGDNTKAALMTRGMIEISRLGLKIGARSETFSGLAGIGDLIVTCTSMHSRNRRAGILIGEGHDLDSALSEVHMVVEGVKTAKAAYELSVKYGVSMPITEQAYSVLFKGKNPKDAVIELMRRDKTNENNIDYVSK